MHVLDDLHIVPVWAEPADTYMWYNFWDVASGVIWRPRALQATCDQLKNYYNHTQFGDKVALLANCPDIWAALAKMDASRPPSTEPESKISFTFL